ncbi:MAG TPA: hypothetical protein VKE51_34050 [Vicinamibacterales bacterium]|nr:hypothetical protein [Vicinamibacterales bacterium]
MLTITVVPGGTITSECDPDSIGHRVRPAGRPRWTSAYLVQAAS